MAEAAPAPSHRLSVFCTYELKLPPPPPLEDAAAEEAAAECLLMTDRTQQPGSLSADCSRPHAATEERFVRMRLIGCQISLGSSSSIRC